MEVLGVGETYWAIAIGMLGGITSLLKDLFKTDALKKGLTIVGLFFVIGGAIAAGIFHYKATYAITAVQISSDDTLLDWLSP